MEGVVPADERELARRVRARIGPGYARGGAGDVDDADAPSRVSCRRRSQQREQGLGQSHGRFEVELHVALDVLPALVAEAPAPRGAGVVDEHVELAAVLTFERGPDLVVRFWI